MNIAQLDYIQFNSISCLVLPLFEMPADEQIGFDRRGILMDSEDEREKM